MLLCCSTSWGEIITDGSVGHALTLQGPNYNITEQLGSRSGANLFHSFQEFNINNGESAIFSGSADINNVISRVTGGNISTINGLLQSNIENADFYFINPAGILFGQTAQIDVPASFYVSTANSILFSDNTEYFSTLENSSSLSIAEPLSFGFVKSSNANITMNGALLTLNPGNTLSINTGTIDINESELLVENGNLHLNTTEEAGQNIPLNQNDKIENNNNSGQINIVQSFLDVSGNGAGTINLNSGNIQLTNSALLNSNIGDNPATGYSTIKADSVSMNQGWIINDNGGDNSSAPINLQVENVLNLKNNSVISSDSYGSGNASKLFISAQNLTVENSLILSNSQQGSGNGNLVTVKVSEDITLLNGSTIGSSTYSNGNAGKVLIESNNLIINAGQTEQFTGIASQAGTGSQGNAGKIQLDINNHLDIQPGGKVSTDSFAIGNAGDIIIKAENLSINRLDNIITGILSQAKASSLGNAGNIDIEIKDSVNINNGGEISTSTFAKGNAGNITLNTNNLNLSGTDSELLTGIFSNAEQESTGHAGNLIINVRDNLDINYADISSDAKEYSQGNAGQVNITADIINMTNGAYIGSNTDAIGDAGNINVTTNILDINGLGKDYTTGIYSDTSSGGDAGTINLIIADNLTMQQGLISSNALPESTGNAGQIKIHVGELLELKDNSVVNISAFSIGNAGIIDVTADRINLLSGGEISSDTYAQGQAGAVNLNTYQLLIDAKNGNSFTGVSSDALINSTGNAGEINIIANDTINILHGGAISSSTQSSGDAGQINITAHNLSVVHNDAIFRTGIFSNAEQDSTGHAGSINLNVEDLLQVTNIGSISSDTYAKGNGGNISIETGSMFLQGLGEIYRTGISSNAEYGSSGNAGSITIISHNEIEIHNGARISSSTFSEGNAGNLSINANSMLLDGSGSVFNSGIFTDAQQDSLGDAGTINIDINRQLTLLSNSKVGSSTYSVGDAGTIKIAAENILIDSQNIDSSSGISTETNFYATGNAGSIEIFTENNLILRQDGNISSFSNTSGNAGNINIVAKNIDIDADNSRYFNIGSAAFENSTGQVGSINLSAEMIYLNNEAEISIAAVGSVSEMQNIQTNQIIITADELVLDNGSFITAQSFGNAPAGSIIIQSSDNFQLHELSSITTSTLNSDGGPITIDASLSYIDNSLISTSVFDEQGNGGNIAINSPVLLMSSGFIQANTAAVGASGGDIIINTEQFITPSNQPFFSNIEQRLYFIPNSQVNVIQAAAPDGVSGQVNISVPVLDLSASVLNIDTRYQALSKVGKNPCKIAPGNLPSSLTWSSQGGLPPPHSENITLPLGKLLLSDETLPKQQGKVYPVNNNQFFSYSDPIIAIQPEC